MPGLCRVGNGNSLMTGPDAEAATPSSPRGSLKRKVARWVILLCGSLRQLKDFLKTLKNKGHLTPATQPLLTN